MLTFDITNISVPDNVNLVPSGAMTQIVFGSALLPNIALRLKLTLSPSQTVLEGIELFTILAAIETLVINKHPNKMNMNISIGLNNLFIIVILKSLINNKTENSTNVKKYTLISNNITFFKV